MRLSSRFWSGCFLGSLAITALGSLAGCDDGGAPGTGGGGAVPNVTFHEHVEPILQRSCLSCHLEGRIGGFSLEKYDEAKPMAGMIAAKTEAHQMPPFPAQDTEDCKPLRPFQDDLRLTEDEIATLRAWKDAGAPEGDPAKAPAPYVPPAIGLPSPDMVLTPGSAGTISGTEDVFECVVYDPALASDKLISGIHVLAGNEKVAHHALVFKADRDDVAAVSGGQPRFPCFGGSSGGSLIHAWAPGGVPLELPADVAMRLGTSDVIVTQMHYHPTGEGAEQDATTIELAFLDTIPLYEYQIALLGNFTSEADGLMPGPNDEGAPEFRIPANVKGHVEEMQLPLLASEVPTSVPILLVANHMHYAGVGMRFWIERATPDGTEPARECFLETPAWDFNWQRGYLYDTPISELPYAGPGDTLHLRCEYDNTMENPFVREALEQLGKSAPEDVFLGETTLDEMCLSAVGFLIPYL